MRALAAGERFDLLRFYDAKMAASVLRLKPDLIRQLAAADFLPAVYTHPRGAFRFSAIDIDEMADRLIDHLAERDA